VQCETPDHRKRELLSLEEPGDEVDDLTEIQSKASTGEGSTPSNYAGVRSAYRATNFFRPARSK
jgi:hypothetical protein